MSNGNLITINTFNTEQIKEVFAEGEFTLADYMPPIMRIIRSEAKVLPKSKSIRNERLCVNGNTEFTVLYLSEDGKLCSNVQLLPFSFTGDFAASEKNFYEIFPTISYLNTRALSPQKLYLKATVELRVSHSEKIEFSAMLPDSGDGIHTHRTELDTFETVCLGHKPLKITDEIRVNGHVASVIRYDISFCETEQKILTEKIVSKADMNLKIVYATTEGNIEVCERKIPVSQILDMNGINENTVCGIKYSPTECRITTSDRTPEESDSLGYEITADVDAIGLSPVKHILCDDAFSEKTELTCKTHSFESTVFSKISKEQTFKAALNIGIYERIFDISVVPVVLNSEYVKENGTVTVSGTFSCKVLYTDENGEYASEEKELPFNVSLQTDTKAERATADAEIKISSFAYVADGNTSAEIRIDFECKGFVFCGTGVSAITETEEKELSLPKETDGVILYYAEKNERIWDISKKYGTDPETVKQKNNITEDILEKNIMLKIRS